MIRILQVNKFYYPYIGGVEKVVQQLSEEMLKVPGVENEVLACHLSGVDKTGTIRGVHVTLAGSIRKVLGMPVSPSFPRLFERLIREKDIVDFHMPFPLAAWCLGKLKTYGTRVVVHYHSDIVRQRWLRRVYEPAFKRLLDRADAIIVSSPNLRDGSELLRTHKDKCFVIPFMVSLPNVGQVPPVRAAALKEHLGIPAETPVVLYVGRFVYYKGLQYLVEAMAGVDAALLLVGDGPLKGELAQTAQRVGIAQRTFWKSGVADEDLADFYALADLFVLPSSHSTEAYGIVQMEALASGLPVVNTNLPTGVPWVSKDGETGLTVRPLDSEALCNAINQILKNPDLNARFKAAALKRAEDFNPQTICNATMKLYRGLLTS